MARWAKPDFTIIYKLSWNQLSEHFLTTAESWWIFLYKILFGLLYLIWSIGQWCYRGWRPQGSEKNRKSKLFAPTSSSDLKILYNWIIKLHSSKYRNIFSQPTTNESKGKKWFRFFLIICEFSPRVKIIKKKPILLFQLNHKEVLLTIWNIWGNWMQWKISSKSGNIFVEKCFQSVGASQIGQTRPST